MAQTGYTPISIYYSATATNVPTAGNLVAGELAINTNDGVLYYKDSSGVVQSIASKAGNSGSFTNLAYTGTLTGGTGIVNLGSGQFYKDASGNVGIGTSSPTQKLQINDAGNVTIQLTKTGVASFGITNNGTAGTVLNVESVPMIFNTANTERMRIDSSGLVSIGTSSGTAGLTVYKYGSTWTGAGANTYSVPAGNVLIQASAIASQTNWIGFTGAYGTSTGSANILLQQNINNTSQQAGNYIGSEATGSTTADLTFGKMVGAATTGGNATKSEAMRIDSSGKLYLNTATGLGFGGGLFYIKNNGDNAIQIEMNSNSSGVSINQNTVSGTYLCYFGYRSSVVGSIQTNGTTTSYNVTSDRRLKENIAPFNNGLQTITSLKPSQYNYISDKENIYQGFIADELQSVVPQAVTGKVNEVDAEGKPIYQGVDASFLIPHLVSAIQELNNKITALEAQLGAK